MARHLLGVSPLAIKSQSKKIGCDARVQDGQLKFYESIKTLPHLPPFENVKKKKLSPIASHPRDSITLALLCQRIYTSTSKFPHIRPQVIDMGAPPPNPLLL